jgi:hypothetical protein
VQIHVDLLIKGFDGASERVKLDASFATIDALIPETYDQAQLTELLAEAGFLYTADTGKTQPVAGFFASERFSPATTQRPTR